MDTHVTDINMLPRWAASKAQDVTVRAGSLMDSADNGIASRALQIHEQHSAAYDRLITAHENYRARAREMVAELGKPEAQNLYRVKSAADRLCDAAERLRVAEAQMGLAFDDADAALCGLEAGGMV